MSTSPDSHELFARYHTALQLSWLAGENAAPQPLITSASESGEVALTGYLNLARPHRIQIAGKAELKYLQRLGKNSQQDSLTELFSATPALLIISDGMEAPTGLLTQAKASGTPTLATPRPAREVLDFFNHHLSQYASAMTIMHGVFMEVMGIGVLLTGPSGIGKSELALELLSRGHRLVADDAPQFQRSGFDTVHGTCPELLQDFIEVRGLGILNVRAMFGDNAIMQRKRLRLIIEMQPFAETRPEHIDRLGIQQRNQQVSGMEIPLVLLPVAPGRNLAVIVEAAVRNHVLQLNGYNSAEDFIQRQKNYDKN